MLPALLAPVLPASANTLAMIGDETLVPPNTNHPDTPDDLVES